MSETDGPVFFSLPPQDVADRVRQLHKAAGGHAANGRRPAAATSGVAGAPARARPERRRGVQLLLPAAAAAAAVQSGLPETAAAAAYQPVAGRLPPRR